MKNQITKLNLTVIVLVTILSHEYSVANCWRGDVSPIMIRHSEGISSVFKRGKSKTELNDEIETSMGVVVDGHRGCFSQRGKLRMLKKTKKDSIFAEITVTPPKVKFENLPNARVQTYLIASASAESQLLTYSTFAAICSNSTAILTESKSGTILTTPEEQVQPTGTRTFVMSIATGASAGAVVRGIDGSGELVPQVFIDLLIQSGLVPAALPSKDVIGGVAVSTDVSWGSVSARSDLTSVQRKWTQLACTPEFEQALSAYNIQRLSQNPTLQGMQVEQSSQQVKLIVQK